MQSIPPVRIITDNSTISINSSNTTSSSSNKTKKSRKSFSRERLSTLPSRKTSSHGFLVSGSPAFARPTVFSINDSYKYTSEQLSAIREGIPHDNFQPLKQNNNSNSNSNSKRLSTTSSSSLSSNWDSSVNPASTELNNTNNNNNNNNITSPNTALSSSSSSSSNTSNNTFKSSATTTTAHYSDDKSTGETTAGSKKSDSLTNSLPIHPSQKSRNSSVGSLSTQSSSLTPANINFPRNQNSKLTRNHSQPEIPKLKTDIFNENNHAYFQQQKQQKQKHEKQEKQKDLFKGNVSAVEAVFIANLFSHLAEAHEGANNVATFQSRQVMSPIHSQFHDMSIVPSVTSNVAAATAAIMSTESNNTKKINSSSPFGLTPFSNDNNNNNNTSITNNINPHSDKLRLANEFSPATLRRAIRTKVALELKEYCILQSLRDHSIPYQDDSVPLSPSLANNTQLINRRINRVDGCYNPLQSIRNRYSRKLFHQHLQLFSYDIPELQTTVARENSAKRGKPRGKFIWELNPIEELADLAWRIKHRPNMVDQYGRRLLDGKEIIFDWNNTHPNIAPTKNIDNDTHNNENPLTYKNPKQGISNLIDPNDVNNLQTSNLIPPVSLVSRPSYLESDFKSGSEVSSDTASNHEIGTPKRSSYKNSYNMTGTPLNRLVQSKSTTPSSFDRNGSDSTSISETSWSNNNVQNFNSEVDNKEKIPFVTSPSTQVSPLGIKSRLLRHIQKKNKYETTINDNTPDDSGLPIIISDYNEPSSISHRNKDDLISSNATSPGGFLESVNKNSNSNSNTNIINSIKKKQPSMQSLADSQISTEGLSPTNPVPASSYSHRSGKLLSAITPLVTRKKKKTSPSSINPNNSSIKSTQTVHTMNSVLSMPVITEDKSSNENLTHKEMDKNFNKKVSSISFSSPPSNKKNNSELDEDTVSNHLRKTKQNNNNKDPFGKKKIYNNMNNLNNNNESCCNKSSAQCVRLRSEMARIYARLRALSIQAEFSCNNSQLIMKYLKATESNVLKEDVNSMSEKLRSQVNDVLSETLCTNIRQVNELSSECGVSFKDKKMSPSDVEYLLERNGDYNINFNTDEFNWPQYLFRSSDNNDKIGKKTIGHALTHYAELFANQLHQSTFSQYGDLVESVRNSSDHLTLLVGNKWSLETLYVDERLHVIEEATLCPGFCLILRKWAGNCGYRALEWVLLLSMWLVWAVFTVISY